MADAVPTVPLGSVVSNLDSKRVPLSQRERRQRPGNIPYFGAAGIIDYIDQALFEGPHLLMGEDGSVAREDGTPYLQLADGAFWVNNHAHVLRGQDDYDTRFLFYALTRIDIRGFVTGAAQPKLSQRNMNQIRIPYPDRSRRRDVVEILSALDDKIQLNRRMNETLEATAQVIFRDWFVDYGPLRRKVAGETDPVAIMGGLVPDPTRAAELAELFPVVSRADGPPDRFQFCSLGEAVSVLETGTRPKGGIKGILTGVPSIGAESIVGLAKFDYGKTKYVPREFFASMRRGVLGDRDVLLYKDGGRPGEFEPHVAMFGAGFPFEECCINEHVYRLVAAAPFSQEYLYLHLSSEGSMDEMRNKGTGVAIPGLNSTAAKSLSILDPGERLLNAFTALVRPMIDAALHNANENRTLAKTRDYLLPRLMSGEVRVTLSDTESAAA